MPLLNNITGKLTKNADKLGMLWVLWQQQENVLADISTLFAGQGHIPDIAGLIKSFPEQLEFKQGLWLYLIGYAAKELGYGKYGRPIQKLGEGFLKGKAIQHTLWWSTHANEGSAGKGLGAMFNRSVVAPNQGYGY